MIVEFTVSNFKSIQNRQTLSMVASKDETYEETHVSHTQHSPLPRVLKAAAIYGANASGKSNFIHALAYFQAVVRESAAIMRPDQNFSFKPFLLDQRSSTEPTEFEITFLLDGIRYQYGFLLNNRRILEEWLLEYEFAKPRMLFTRSSHSDESDAEYIYGASLKGQKQQWEDLTRNNALFLSTAAQWNSQQLTPIFDYIVNDIVILQTGHAFNPRGPNGTINTIKKSNGKSAVLSFLHSADIAIEDIELEKKQGRGFKLTLSDKNQEIETDEALIEMPKFLHRQGKKEAYFDSSDESTGTNKLFELAGPLLEILKEGKVLVVDELDTSIHTLLLEHIVSLFHDSNKDAQLIFSVHNTELLNGPYLRRDQIWLVEKDVGQSTNLFSLIEFKPRKGEALEKGYLSGRYGALPILNSFEAEI